VFNLVGFQTHLKFGEQKRVFSMIPALRNAEYVRYGVMHQNTFLQSPKLLDKYYADRRNPLVAFAGQMTGVEGYVESCASGYLAAVAMAAKIQGRELPDFPKTTAIGALEHLFSTIQATYPDAEVCYVLKYVCVQAGYPSDAFRNDFAPLARQACEKWGVHCLDLVDNEAFNAEFDATAPVHTYDGVHANTEGYVVLTKYIAPWLEEIIKNA
jgi:methylenetetrahydrofolate--tRNA-(uracil-5-)-methyltransferase